MANMVGFAEVFLDKNILQSLIAKLGWTHFQRIIPLADPLKRDCYAEICCIERTGKECEQRPNNMVATCLEPANNRRTAYQQF